MPEESQGMWPESLFFLYLYRIVLYIRDNGNGVNWRLDFMKYLNHANLH